MKNVYVDFDEKLNEKVSSITMTNYKGDNNRISVDMLISMIEDLVVEYHNLQETLDDTLKDIDDNYIAISKNEMYE